MAVDELTAVIRIESQRGERQAGPQAPQSFEHGQLACVQHALETHPTGGHVHGAEREQELSSAAGATMGHEVDLEEARAAIVPVGEGADGHLALKQCPGLGETAAPSGPPLTIGLEAAVDR